MCAFERAMRARAVPARSQAEFSSCRGGDGFFLLTNPIFTRRAAAAAAAAGGLEGGCTSRVMVGRGVVAACGSGGGSGSGGSGGSGDSGGRQMQCFVLPNIGLN
jgi:hypothetical protein